MLQPLLPLISPLLRPYEKLIIWQFPGQTRIPLFASLVRPLHEIRLHHLLCTGAGAETPVRLPIELSREQTISLVREYCRKHFIQASMIADICIHDKNNGNPHAHTMLTMRPMEQHGSWAAKSKKEYIIDGNGERIRLKSGEYKSRDRKYQS